MPDQFLQPSQSTYRLLSMDGGGIYGLATALLLKSLCERNPQFLSRDDVWMFAGTSAGALNALLLANQDKPRQFVLSGELERFWHQHGLFGGYSNPQEQWLSLWSVIPWFAPEPFRGALEQYFGSLTLGALKHRVLITTFDWSGGGGTSWRPKMFYNFPDSEPDRDRRIVDVAHAAGAPPGMRSIPHGLGDGGIFVPNPSVNAIAKAVHYFAPGALDRVMPILFHLSDAIETQLVFLDQLDPVSTPPLDAPLGDFQSAFQAHLAPLQNLQVDDADIESCLNKLLALTSTTPPTLDDPGVIKELVDNEVQLLKATYRLYQLSSEHPDAQASSRIEQILTRARQFCDSIPPGTGIYGAADQLMLATQATALACARARAFLNIILERIRLLSVGVCSIIPTLNPNNYNAGLNTFYNLPTNAPEGNLWPPSTFIGLDAPSEDAVYVSRQLIYQRFHRLSPQLFGPPDTLPTLPATLYARDENLYPIMIAAIEKIVASSPDAAQALRHADTYLRRHWHNQTP